MNKLMKKQKKNNKGFSLVELIVVIAIMAVLVGVIAPQFLGYTAKAKKATDVQNAQMLAQEIAIDIAEGTIGETVAKTEITESVVTEVPTIQADDTYTWNYEVANGAVTISVVKGETSVELYPTVGDAWSAE